MSVAAGVNILIGVVAYSLRFEALPPAPSSHSCGRGPARPDHHRRGAVRGAEPLFHLWSGRGRSRGFLVPLPVPGDPEQRDDLHASPWRWCWQASCWAAYWWVCWRNGGALGNGCPCPLLFGVFQLSRVPGRDRADVPSGAASGSIWGRGSDPFSCSCFRPRSFRGPVFPWPTGW